MICPPADATHFNSLTNDFNRSHAVHYGDTYQMASNYYNPPYVTSTSFGYSARRSDVLSASQIYMMADVWHRYNNTGWMKLSSFETAVDANF
jgi:hypothetical protein